MNPKYALSTTFLGDNLPLSEVLPRCVDLGFNSIELGSNHLHELDLSFVKQYKVDYLVHNYFPTPRIPFVVNIASFDEEIRRKSINHVKSSILYCQEINAKIYTFHPGFIGDPSMQRSNIKSYDFSWDKRKIQKTEQQMGTDNMFRSLDEICEFSKKINISIAIETEGSYVNASHLLMQTPDEYEIFLKQFNKNDIKLNLNIGHLYLSSRFNKFSISDFLNLVADRVIALELSHNNGIEDEHLPLVDGAWYWPIISDDRFKSAYKILEFRHATTEMVRKSLELLIKHEKK